MGAICGGDRTMPKDTPPPDENHDRVRSHDPVTPSDGNANNHRVAVADNDSTDFSHTQDSTLPKSTNKRQTRQQSIPSQSIQSSTVTGTTLKNRFSQAETNGVSTASPTTDLINNTSNTSISAFSTNSGATETTTTTTNGPNGTNAPNYSYSSVNTNNNNTKNGSTTTNTNNTNDRLGDTKENNNSNKLINAIRRNSAQKLKNRNETKNVSENKHKKGSSSTGAKLAQSIAKSIKNSIKNSQSKIELNDENVDYGNYERQHSQDSGERTESNTNTNNVENNNTSGGAIPNGITLPSTTATPHSTNNNPKSLLNNNINGKNNNNRNSQKKTRFSDLASPEIVSPSIVDSLLIGTHSEDVGDDDDNENSSMDDFVEISDEDGNLNKPFQSVPIGSLHSINEDTMLEDDLKHNNDNKRSKSPGPGPLPLKRPPSVDIATKTLNQANYIIAQSPKSVEDQIEELIRYHSNGPNRAEYIFLQSAFFTRAGTNNGKTKKNQDSYFAYDKYGPGDLFQFYGVADGHGRAGDEVSQYVTKLFPEMLCRNNESKLLLLKDTKLALKKGFLDLEMKSYDDIANKKVRFDIEYSGTTLTCGIRFGNTLYLGNLGDSRTILGRIPANFNLKNARKRMMSVPLSVDHDPSAPEEMERIKNFGNAKINFDEDGYARIDIAFTHDLLHSPETNNLGILGTFGATKEDADEKDKEDIDDEFLDDKEIQSIRSKQAAMKKVSERRASLSQNTLNISVTEAKSPTKSPTSSKKNSLGNIRIGRSGSNISDTGDDSVSKSNENDGGNQLLSPNLNIDYSNNKYIPPPRKSKLIKNLKKISSSVSRSFGDRIAHKYGGLITEPDIRVYEFGEQDCFVIWASDGIWSMLDNSEVTDIVSKKLMESHDNAICKDLDKVAKRLVNTANGIWIDECEGYTDDITAVIARIGKRRLLYPDEIDVIQEDATLSSPENGPTPDNNAGSDSDDFEPNGAMFVDIDAV